MRKQPWQQLELKPRETGKNNKSDLLVRHEGLTPDTQC